MRFRSRRTCIADRKRPRAGPGVLPRRGAWIQTRPMRFPGPATTPGEHGSNPARAAPRSAPPPTAGHGLDPLSGENALCLLAHGSNLRRRPRPRTGATCLVPTQEPGLEGEIWSVWGGGGRPGVMWSSDRPVPNTGGHAAADHCLQYCCSSLKLTPAEALKGPKSLLIVCKNGLKAGSKCLIL
jgi:hypothetical protein